MALSQLPQLPQDIHKLIIRRLGPWDLYKLTYVNWYFRETANTPLLQQFKATGRILPLTYITVNMGYRDITEWMVYNMDNVQDWNLICHVFQGTLKFGWLDLVVFMYKKYSSNTDLFKGICIGDIVTAGYIDVLEWIPVEIYKSYYTGRLRWIMIPHICSSGNPEVYKLLTKKLDVKQEEIIRMPTNEKYNIIKYAVKNEHYQMVDYLENTGIFNVTNMILPLLVDFCYEEEWYVVDAIVNRYDCMEYFINNRVSVNLSQKKYDYGKASKIFRILVNKYGCKLHHNNHSIILSLARKCQPDDMIDIMNMFVAEIKKSVTATSDQK